jgi:hypothetical protein
MPREEAGFAGHYLQTRVMRIVLIWVGPVLLLCIAAVFAGVLRAPWWVNLLLLLLLVPLFIYRREFENTVDAKAYSWFVGREAEWDVRDALFNHLGDDFYLLNDVVLPGRSGNIDHIVVGPSGVHVIETKGDIGDVDATADRLLVRRYPKDDYLRKIKARRQSVRAFLQDRLPGDFRTYPVFPVIVFTRASDVQSRGTTGGVCVENIAGLLRLLDKYADRNVLDELHRAQVFHALAPRVASAGKSRAVEFASGRHTGGA